MSSWQARLSESLIRIIVRRRHWGDEKRLARRARRLFGAPAPYARLIAYGLQIDRVETNRVRGEWVIPRDPRPGVLFYVHGGGFVSCSAATHRPITAALARLTRRRVFAVDYRLAPEFRLPAAHDDVLSAYSWLREAVDTSTPIAVAGDSAGGNLALALAIHLRDSKGAMPTCLVAFSPWTDLTGSGKSVRRNEGRCAMFHPENIRDFAAAALGGDETDAGDMSPLSWDLHDLPPVLLHVGTTELLLDDSRRVHDKILAAGGACELSAYENVPHCWQMLAHLVPEATRSLREAAAFIDRAMIAQLQRSTDTSQFAKG